MYIFVHFYIWFFVHSYFNINSQLRAFTQNKGDVYKKIIDISTKAKREEKIQELEKRIRKKANKKLFGTTGVKIPVSKATEELYNELKNIWYQKAI